MYTVKDLEPPVEVINLQEVEKYYGIVNDIIKYLKRNKHEIVNSLLKSKADDFNTKMFRFGSAVDDPENGIIVEVSITE